MCGRYHFAEQTVRSIQRMGVAGSDFYGKSGDIHPSDLAVVITGSSFEANLTVETMRWGFPFQQTKQLMINARAEKVLEKRSFADSVLARRCVIPAQHFYEWDADKNKVIFSSMKCNSVKCSNETDEPLYMAGFYRMFEDGNHFIILTTEANASMRPVHERMPLILGKTQIREWIYDVSKTREFLKQESPQLKRYQEYEQLSLF